jgi:hypothetical protein
MAGSGVVAAKGIDKIGKLLAMMADRPISACRRWLGRHPPARPALARR